MGNITYDGMKFDSQLEADYWAYLKTQDGIIAKLYHLNTPIQVTRGNTYTPDFVVIYSDRIEIVETKGYNPYSKMRDDMIHQVMLSKSEQDLKQYLIDNGFTFSDNNKKIIYRKIKYLKAYGFVDWDFKNPNTIANKRKAKIDDLSVEIKDLREFQKDTIRYWGYQAKIAKNEKITKQQREWIVGYTAKMIKMVGGTNESNS